MCIVGKISWRFGSGSGVVVVDVVVVEVFVVGSDIFGAKVESKCFSQQIDFEPMCEQVAVLSFNS